ncbi:AAA family ATPase [Actinoplanes sp. LDG1-06]|uniref:AAA family ATPase n=1 Tax=Paractinoplanes ovalisporus TaxID=2810368 RepID=A0ABS2A3L9_9ACTN|nr:AAA family ATPase [Actinoplanes ovalisporus]MBM2614409.1 AAA family ATPase [Actinoplanes ovalisporus]
MPAELRVRLLGGFRVEVAGRVVPESEWQRNGAVALVKILAVHSRMHREQAIDLLWPEAGPDLGQSRLNKALHYARRVLGGDRIRLRDDMLALEQAELWTDVRAFEAAARESDIDAALMLYAGDLLPENRFDAWAEQPRARLRNTVVSMLLERASRDDLERVVVLDPLHEVAHGRLMRLESEQGQRHRAIRRYEQLAALLRDELGIEPAEDLRRLHNSLINEPPARALDATHEQRGTLREQQNAQSKERDAQFAHHDAQPEDRDAQLAHHNAQPEDRDAQLAHHNAQPEDRDAQLAHHNAQPEDRDAQLAHHNAQPKERDAQLAHHNAQTERRSAQLAPRDAQPEQRAAPPGQRLASPGEFSAAPEERKLVTVLDADLRGVRGANADADPERARRETSGWTALLTEIVTRWGGAAQPLMGGGVIGVFGWPEAREDHAARALWAGREIIGRFPGPIRLGVDTGEIIAPGEPRPQVREAMPNSATHLLQISGTVPNNATHLPQISGTMPNNATHLPQISGTMPNNATHLPQIGGTVLNSATQLAQVGGAVLDGAARLRAKAGDGELVTGERTQLAARRHGDFRVEATSPGVWRVVGAAPAPSDDAGPVPPMVGRDAELRAVLSLVDEAAASGRPRLITVAGPAGIGKTRLVREVVGRRPDMRVLRGRCLAAGDGITYWALGEILREACGIPFGESGERAQQKLRTRLAPLLPERTVFALAATAGIRMPGNPLDQADPREVDEELGRAWPRLASVLAVREPLLLIVEDLHWAGAPLVAMLSRLIARAEGPVIVLSTARPEFLDAHPRVSDVVVLRALSETDGRALLEALPQQVGLRQRARILARADGNPYFLEQLAAHVAEGGNGTLPDTVHALLAARIDALPADEKRVLQRAAVIGRTFWATPLRATTGQLQQLENRGLIRARPASTMTGQDEYAFQHALLRDVAYAGLPVAQRAAGHAETAAWLEEVSRERIGEVIELVAVHYAAAAEGPDSSDWVRGKAFRSLIAAGAGARRRFAVGRALDLHRRALRHAEGAAERAEAIEAVGDDHETAYAGDEAIAAWREAITALPKDDRRARLCLKTAQMVVARWGGFRTPADPALGDRVVDEGLAAVIDPSVKAQLLALRALCGGRWAWTGRLDPVPVARRRRAADDAKALADGIGSAPLRGLALLGVAAVHFLEERYEDAVAAVLEEVALVEQDGRDRDRALGHLIAALVIGAVRGDYVVALEHARRSYEWARSLSPHDRLHGTATVMTCLEQLGRYDEIDPYLDEHLALRQGPVAAMACPYIRSGPLVGALALARRGEPDRAKTVADTVDVDLVHPGNAEVLRARLSLRLGDVTTARSLAERLMSMNRRPGPEEIPHEALALLETLEAAGDRRALREFLPRARKASGYLALMTDACDRAERFLSSAESRPGTVPPTGHGGRPSGR